MVDRSAGGRSSGGSPPGDPPAGGPPPGLWIVPVYLPDDGALLRRLGVHLQRTFRLAVEVHPPWFDPERAFDPSRGQYRSTVLLAALLTAPGPARLLAVAGVDLFIPVLTYVFGEAQHPGRAAAVSTYRLHPERYGLAADPELLAERLIKEAVHELGHTYGLVHCHRPGCVMNPSPGVEGIDLKEDAFCPACAADLAAGAASAAGS